MKIAAIAILTLAVALLAYQRHQDVQRLQSQQQAITSLQREAAALRKAQQAEASARAQTFAAYEQARPIATRYRQTLAANSGKK